METRTEWEQRNLDLLEEGKLRKLDAVQASLNGMWRETLGGCPHRHGVRDSVDVCDANEMRACVYELNDEPCELFQQILDEWTKELEICVECGQVRPDDERVKSGMKCASCAGEWIPEAYAQMEENE